MMNKQEFEHYNAPVFYFEPGRRQGRIINPATGRVVLEFPAKRTEKGTFALHQESWLSASFASYLYYLVHAHILFTRPATEEVIGIDAGESENPTDADEPEPDGVFDYATVWFRAPLEFEGLSGVYDRLGFSFIDGALYSALYCEVYEPTSQEIAAPDLWGLFEQ